MKKEPSVAISPTVNAFLQQEQAPASTAEQTFRKSFGDAAFDLLRAKAPDLVRHAATFRILATDLDRGNGLGVFVIQAGDAQRYIPVVLADGAVGGCEMLYDQDADQFSPLSAQAIQTIQGRNRMEDARVLAQAPHVEDTRELFRNLLRPPASSNVLLGSPGLDVASLPAMAKSQVAAHFLTHPPLLGKIASFYPVRDLAVKLTADPTPAALPPIPHFLRLDKLTKQAAIFLREEERRELLQYGYLAKRASDSAVADLDSLEDDLQNRAGIEAYPPGGMRPGREDGDKGHWPVFSASVVCCGPRGFRRISGLAAGPLLLGPQGAWADLTERGALLADRTAAVSEAWLQELGGTRVEGVATKLAKMGKTSCRAVICCPARHSGFLSPRLGTNWFQADRLQIRHIDGDTFLEPPAWSRVPIHISGLIRYGYIRREHGLVVPRETVFFLLQEDGAPAMEGRVGSFEELRRLLPVFGTPLRTLRDGVDLRISEPRARKTASFRNDVDAAAWLHASYGLSGEQIRTVLHNPRTVLVKRAFDAAPPPVAAPTAEAGPVFDPSLLDAWADTGEPAMVDTGILAAFAQDPDIKTMLVDYLPDFVTVLDKLGRVILLFTLRKDDIEAFYGRDKYAATLGNVRKIFAQIGDLVNTLEQYVNMH